LSAEVTAKEFLVAVSWPTTIRMSNAFPIAALFALLGACGSPPPPVRTITAGHLPPGAAFRADAGALTLKLSYDASGTPNGFAAGSPDDADLVIGFINTSTVKIENHMKQALKVDLWLSQDGRRFGYTTSCPISAGSSSHEIWPGRVPWVYVSGPRWVPPAEAGMCK
jgi:hypothetical protein